MVRFVGILQKRCAPGPKPLRRRLVSSIAMLLAAIGVPGAPARAGTHDLTAQLQRVLDSYIAERGQPEGISGVALQVDLGGGKPAIALFSGNNGLPDTKPIDSRTLFQIGSNTKHFTAALILMLEAAGRLNIDQTVGDWLPQYPAWKRVTIRSLLNMTSPIPNYSETPEIGRLIAADIHQQFTDQELIAAVDPGNGKSFPTPTGWFYSNTNNILAGLIIEAASGMDYRTALETMILKPLHLRDTFYSNGDYPPRIEAREPRGLFENAGCLLYQPEPCTTSTLAPLIGKDVHMQNMSWAGPAGAIVSNMNDLDLWIRALFGLKVFPQQQLDEMTSIVSQKTGLAITDVSAGDPLGFGLDLGRAYQEALGGAVWFYQGTTLGFRATFVYWPHYDLVMTTATNSQPPEGEDSLNKLVVGSAFTVLKESGALGTGN